MELVGIVQLEVVFLESGLYSDYLLSHIKGRRGAETWRVGLVISGCLLDVSSNPYLFSLLLNSAINFALTGQYWLFFRNRFEVSLMEKNRFSQNRTKMN